MDYRNYDRGYAAVSYTHLDVYKRQVEALGSEPLEEGVGVPAAAHAVDHLGTVQIFPVSYTHLDVYKRQVLK